LKNISSSVASNALTVTLNPCTLNFRSSTLTSGAFLTRSVPTAITLTVSSGSTLGTTSAVESKLAIVAIDNAGTVELAIVNATVYGTFNEAALISTTAEGGVGGADSGSVFYSTTARTSVAFRVIGYVTSTQATAGTWASAPSNLSGNSVLNDLSITNFTGANQSLGSSGYQKLPGGLIMQWGETGAMSGGQNLTVTYPIAFPTAVFNVQTTVIVSSDTNEITFVNTVGTTTFVVANSNPGGLTGVYWLAFGY
jgi:hypothetical protein